ncbi:hypothetical protein C2E23DRAFT_715586, partial [Lenzites betulinus]
STTTCRECPGRPSSCSACAVSSHRHLPFHWLSYWNGRFFERRDLSAFGHVINLGHHGGVCPHLPTGQRPLAFVIVHTNGVHHCKLHYCHCTGRRVRLSQLVCADLFPATLERTETAFTCEILERFHLDFDISKRSVQDFVRVLEQLSPPDPNTRRVKDRYRDFFLASRIYRHITMMKRAGKIHDIQIPGRDPNDITTPCFTCPIPDFNLPPDWKEIDENLRYLDRLILSADGNYSLQKKTKPSDTFDIALSSGQAFFYHSGRPAEPTSADEIVMTRFKSQGITCTGFKVARSQRPGKFKNVDNSGVLCYSCNHMLFRPGATVDLHTTETWVHGDYGLAGALRGTESL